MNPSKKTDSLLKRFLIKFLSSFFTGVVNLAIQPLILRGLGPAQFGNYQYLKDFFAEIFGLFGIGTYTAFYVKISQRPHEINLFRYYILFVTLVPFLLFSGVIFFLGFSSSSFFLPNQKLPYIYLALGFSILIWFANHINQTSDALGKTLNTEKVKMIKSGLGLLIIFFLYHYGKLNLKSYFYFQYALWGWLIISMTFVLKHSGVSFPSPLKLPGKEFLIYTREIFFYSHPLITHSIFQTLAVLWDIWMLQHFGGSIEQGFLGLGYQVNTGLLMILGTMYVLFMRDISIAFHKKDSKEISNLFKTYVPRFHILTVYFTCFFAFQAPWIVKIMGGSEYQGAIPSVFVLSFLPVFLIFRGFMDSIFFGSNRISLYRNIGIFFSLAGVPLTIFLLSSHQFGGLQGGAEGLALKKVLLEFLLTTTQLFFIAHSIGVNFRVFLRKQMITLFIGILIAWTSVYCVNQFPYLHGTFTSFFLSGILYTAVFFLPIMFIPSIFGIQKKETQFVTALLLKFFSKITQIFHF